MANEPERPIEKLLRAAAQKRRDEAGGRFELHPANRRLLQGEVTRTFPKTAPEPRSFASLMAQLWPRFAGALAILAVLGMAVWLLVPVPGSVKREAFLAKNQPASAPAPSKSPITPTVASPAAIAPSPAPVAKNQPEVVAFETAKDTAGLAASAHAEVDGQTRGGASVAAPVRSRDADRLALATPPQLADRQEAARRQLAVSGTTPAPAPAATVNGALEPRYGLAVGPASTAGAPPAPAGAFSLAAKTAGAAAAAADESGKSADAKLDQPTDNYQSLVASAAGNRLRQNSTTPDSLLKSLPATKQYAREIAAGQPFKRVMAESKEKPAFADKSAAAPSVLASFNVEQTGRDLRIVDSDGSVYRGYVQLATATRRARGAKTESAPAARASQATESESEAQVAPGIGLDLLAPPTYSFRVTGTNRSLNKKIVFTGNFLTATNLALSLPGGTNLGLADSLGGYQAQPAQSNPQPLLHSRITGKLVIGSESPLEINAVPARP